VERVTLEDVARRVGVSAKTVSNVVHGTGRVSTDQRELIQKVIEELGYRPNIAARELRQGRSGVIALALPDLREPYFADLASYFVAAAKERGRNVLITQTGGDRDSERSVMEAEDLPSVGTIVLSPLRLTAEDVARRKNTTSLVLLGEQAEEFHSATVAHVGVSNVRAAQSAVEHLIARGRRRIAAVGVQREGPNASSTLRAEGYARALAGAGLPADESLRCEVDLFSRAAGSAAVQRLIDAGTDFDALFCFNDSMAFGALYTLAQNGIRVPDDVAVVGFDDVDEARYTIPALTSVGPGPRKISGELFQIIDGPDADRPIEHLLDYEVVVRESS
jgi:DNA-binding LacI/PurR family transcriptional regulator